MQGQRKGEHGLMGLGVARQELQRERGRVGAGGLRGDYKDRPWSLTWAKRKGCWEALTGGEMVLGAKERVPPMVQACCRGVMCAG